MVQTLGPLTASNKSPWLCRWWARVFGAHGGALDRLDAVLFAAVVGYYIWSAYV